MDDQATVQPEQDVQDVSKPEDDLSAKIEAARAEAIAEASERYKSEISGLNRKVSELSKVLDEQKTASMTAEEKLKFELEKEKNELITLQSNFNREQNKQKAITKAVELGMPIGFIDSISMDNWDVVDEQITKFKAILDSEKSKWAEGYAKGNGDTPRPGAISGGKSPKDYTAQELTELYKSNPEEAKRILSAQKKG
jgi:seryl-tRNA synthetase